MNFEYARKLTAVNAISLAGLAWVPKSLRMLELAESFSHLPCSNGITQMILILQAIKSTGVKPPHPNGNTLDT